MFGPLSIDIASRQVFLDGELIPLTRTEFDILAALASRPGVGGIAASSSTPCGASRGRQRPPRRRPCRAPAAQTRRRPADPRFVFTVRGWATGWAAAE